MAARQPTPSLRLRLDLDYDGSAFHGWASQPGLRTVAGVLSDALAVALRVAADDVSLVVAGRTDAGVHASGQVCHLDLAREVDLDRLTRSVRGLLPADVRLRRVVIAPPGFDARFAALRRHYEYRLDDDPAGVAPLARGYVVAHSRPLDVEAMSTSSQQLLGLHDFAAFCKRRDQPAGTATTIRTLERFTWRRDVAGQVVTRLSADAFCHSMVRALVGALLSVGDGRRPVDWPAAVLAAGVRDPAVTVAPAHGLRLVAVDYPPDEGLAARAVQARAVRSATPG